MATAQDLEIGQEVGIKTKRGKSFRGALRRVKGGLLAVSVTSGLKDRSSLSVGTSVQIIPNGEGDDAPLAAVIKQDKAFPLLIISLKSAAGRMDRKRQIEEEEDVEDLISSISDPKYLDHRDSARTEDSFPIEFYKQSAERANAKKNEYLIRPSRQRREVARQGGGSQGPVGGIDEQTIRARIGHMDPVLQEIIVDLYNRTASNPVGAARKQPQKGPDDKNIGICVDISGTGLRFLSSQRLEPGDILKTMIEPRLADPPFSISALVEVRKVTRVKKPDPPHKKYAVGVKYFAMHEEDMEEITRYTFKLQRDQLSMKRQLKSA